ncbi:MAG: NAD(P)-dependent oxidoreductase [Pseudomonadota bacterium]
MRVFLTGGTGFIGLALTGRLLRDGADVVSVAEAPPPDWATQMLGGGVTFQTLDIRDKHALTSAMREARPDVLIHGAALTPDEKTERAGGTAAIFEVNVGGTANALEAAAAAGVGRVMAFSSGAAYGRTLEDTDVLDEVETECRPTALYAVSKLAAEKVALRLGALHGLSVATPRLSAAWGPWEYSTPHRQTLSPPWQMIETVLDGTLPSVPDGAALPLIYSQDAAEMLVRLAVSEAEGVFNVGIDRMIDLHEFAKNAAAAAGGKFGSAKRRIELFTTGRPPMRLDRLRAVIGELPRTETDRAIEQTIAWTRSTRRRGDMSGSD